MKIPVFLLIIVAIAFSSCDDHASNVLAGTQWQSTDPGTNLMTFTKSELISYRNTGSCFAHWTSCYSVKGNRLTVRVMCMDDEINVAEFRIRNDTLYTTNIDPGDPDPETYVYVAYPFDEAELNICQ